MASIKGHFTYCPSGDTSFSFLCTAPAMNMTSPCDILSGFADTTCTPVPSYEPSQHVLFCSTDQGDDLSCTNEDALYTDYFSFLGVEDDMWGIADVFQTERIRVRNIPCDEFTLRNDGTSKGTNVTVDEVCDDYGHTSSFSDMGSTATSMTEATTPCDTVTVTAGGSSVSASTTSSTWTTTSTSQTTVSDAGSSMSTECTHKTSQTSSSGGDSTMPTPCTCETHVTDASVPATAPTSHPTTTTTVTSSSTTQTTVSGHSSSSKPCDHNTSVTDASVPISISQSSTVTSAATITSSSTTQTTTVSGHSSSSTPCDHDTSVTDASVPINTSTPTTTSSQSTTEMTSSRTSASSTPCMDDTSVTDASVPVSTSTATTTTSSKSTTETTSSGASTSSTPCMDDTSVTDASVPVSTSGSSTVNPATTTSQSSTQTTTNGGSTPSTPCPDDDATDASMPVSFTIPPEASTQPVSAVTTTVSPPCTDHDQTSAPLNVGGFTFDPSSSMSTGPGGGPGYHGNGGPGHHKPGHHGPGHHGDGGPGYYGNGYPAPAAPIGTAGTVPLGSGSVVIYPTGAYSWTNETANHTAPVVPTRTKTEVVIPTDSEPSMTYIVTEVGQPSSQPTPTSTAAPAGNAGSRAKIPSGLQFWCTMLLMMSTFLQGALASPNSGSAIKRQDDPVDVPDNIDSDDNNIVTASGSESEDDSQDDGTRDLKAQVLSVQDTFTDFYASAVPDSDLGVTLVQAAAEAVCNASRQAIQEHPDDWTHREDVVMSLIGECSDSINSFSYNGADEFDTKPQGRLLLRLGSSWVCSQFISLVLEEEEDAVDAICDNVQKPCSEDLLNDDDNCGRCGNQCPSGSTCSHGSCSTPSCKAATCSTFTPCAPGQPCVCVSTAEDDSNNGYCYDGRTLCSGLSDCDASSDCASGEVCAVDTCCRRNVCLPVGECTAASSGGNGYGGGVGRNETGFDRLRFMRGKDEGLSVGWTDGIAKWGTPGS